jgi:hypothetical protein
LLFFKFLFCKYQNIFTANIFKQNTLAVFPGHFSLRNTAAVFKKLLHRTKSEARCFTNLPIQRRLRTIKSRNRQVNPQSPDAVSANIVIFNFRTAGLSADDRRIAVLNTAFRVFLKGKRQLTDVFQGESARTR